MSGEPFASDARAFARGGGGDRGKPGARVKCGVVAKPAWITSPGDVLVCVPPTRSVDGIGGPEPRRPSPVYRSAGLPAIATALSLSQAADPREESSLPS